ncbi:MAG: oxidoreductase [Mucilaginibacter polytrichastri]|nr:oxidoreductase [Mucilaginibacter polytrichastri]
MKMLLSWFLLILPASLIAQTLQKLPVSPCKSLRGLSVVDDRVAWASGTQGYVGITKDGGNNWQWLQVPGFETLDFRDVEAFSDQKAVIMSSGTPAVILTTDDGGKTWQTRYRSNDKAVFLDEMDFSDEQHGTILGDPIGGKFLLMSTGDGGRTWQEVKNRPEAMEGEACFAASGTGIRYINANRLAFVTGGSIARLFILDGEKWVVKSVPVTHGRASQGVFSFDRSADGRWIFVGGDYLNTKSPAMAAVFARKVETASPEIGFSGVSGYRSSVEWVDKKLAIATGPSGTEISKDGKRWRELSTDGYNVCRRAKNGSLVLLAGSKGDMAKLVAN